MSTYQDMLAQKLALDAKLEEMRAQEQAKVKEQILAMLAENDMTVEDLMTRRRGRPAGVKKEAKPAKYRDPKTGATWSGFGRAPQWLTGKKKEKFLINPEA